MKKSLKEIIDKEVFDYGYDEYAEKTETDTDIIVDFQVDNEYCDANIIYDLGGILQDITKDWCDQIGVWADGELKSLPLIRAYNKCIRVIFNKSDYDNIVKI